MSWSKRASRPYVVIRNTLLLVVLLFSVALAVGRKPAAGPVQFETVASGDHSGVVRAKDIVVTSAEQWAEVWRQTYKAFEPMPELPAIDFSKKMVLCSFMGQRTSSGYSIAINKVENLGDSLVVEVVLTETPGMLTVMTSPFHMVSIDVTDLPVLFVRTTSRLPGSDR